MISIITGDIINSRNAGAPGPWLQALKDILSTFGPAPRYWELYRGDSFQLKLEQPEDTFHAFLLLKSGMKSLKGLDLRMAAGIGTQNYSAAAISESNGQAFIFSGEQFALLQQEKLTLSIRTTCPELDEEINLFLRFALLAIDNWTTATAELVNLLLRKPGLGQQEAGALLGIAQSSVSERQSRSHITELLALDALFRVKISKLLNPPS